jgi:serine/threonine protein kinase
MRFAPRVIGRYALHEEIAAGGMATVHYGRLLGPVGFSRTVAIKRLHEKHARDPEFVSMFLDEARLAARIRHPNVVQTLDVVALDGELFLVMDYVQGESLSRLIRASGQSKKPIPLDVVSAIICGTLLGLHAAHEATNERGEPLGIVHRDVSPQNVIVSADGIPRVLDFGVAKAAGRMQTTREGQLKGKLSYMAPEQLNSAEVDRRADVYAAGVVLWETLTLTRLFTGDSEGGIVTKVLMGGVKPPSALASVPEVLDRITLRALEYDPSKRFESARQMALELEAAIPLASATRVAEWVERLVGELLAERAESVARIEGESGSGPVPMPGDPDAEVTKTATPTERSEAPSPTSPLSQVSSISVSTSALQRQLLPSSRRRPGVFAAGGVALLAVGAFLGLAALRPGANRSSASATQPPPREESPTPARIPAPPPPPSEASSLPAVPSSEAAPPPNVASAHAPAPRALVGSLPPAVAPKAAKAAPAVATVPVASTQPVPVASTQPASAPGASATCSITSYMDGSGIKHFTKECK